LYPTEIIISRDLNLTDGAIGGQAALDFLLWRYRDRYVAFDNTLAGQRVSQGDIVRG
jgi:hypothetical protein